MRFSIASVALCSAITASAAAVPNKDAVELVDLSTSKSHSFPMITLEQAKAGIEAGVIPHKSDAEVHADVASADVKATATGNSCRSPAVRVEWRNMKDGDKKAFMGAIKCLMGKPGSGHHPGSQSRYDDLVSVHQQLMPTIHLVGQFLPWHRWFLHIYEDVLRSECSYRGPMPWWDESRDAGHFSSSPMFTDRYFGKLPAKTNNGQGTCITKTGFGRVTLHVGPQTSEQNRCLARAADESIAASAKSEFVQACHSRSKFWDMASCSERGPHAVGHNAVGASMADVYASPGDPVFWMHHAWIDRNWRMWQNGDHAKRLHQINGPTKQDGSGAVTLDYKLTSQGLRNDIKVRDVMDTQGGFLCYKYDY